MAAVRRLAGPWLTDRDMRVELRWRYGQPTRITSEAVVRGLLAGPAQAGVGSGRRVAVFRYRSREAAEAYARVNRVRYGLTVFGPFDTVFGPVCVIDLGEAKR